MGTYQHKSALVRCAFGLLGVAALAFLSAPAANAGAALNLTPQQQQKLGDLESSSHTQAADLIAQIQQIRQKLSDLYRDYNFDASAARRLNQDLNRVQGQLLDQHLSEQQQLRGILSADQFGHLQAEIHAHGFRHDHQTGGSGHGHTGPGWPDH